MRPEELSVTEFMEYCLREGIPPIETLSRDTLSSKTTPSTETAEDAPTIKELVVRTLDEVRTSGKSITLDTLCDLIAVDMQKAPAPDSNTPLKGLVADALYEYASEAKTAGLHERTAKRNQLQNPVAAEELEGLLHVRIDDLGARRIVGELSAQVIQEAYPIHDGKFQDEDGNSYNIEGAINWDRAGKRTARERLVAYAEQDVLAPLQEEHAQRIAELEKQREKLKERASIPRKNNHTIILSGERGPLMTLDHRFVKGFLYEQNTEGITIDPSINERRIEVECETETDRQRFLAMWEEFSGRNNFCQAISMSSRTEGHGNRRKRLLNNVQLIEEQLKIFRTETIDIEYCGLEGPHFASYLSLRDAAARRGIGIHTTAVEYDRRLANIMESIVETNPDGLFSDVDVLWGNIDKYLLADRLLPESLHLSGRAGDYTVMSGNDSIRLQRLYDLADGESLSTQHASASFGVSPAFVEMVRERSTRPFDILFLDYIGPFSRKRLQTLETVMQRHVNDRAVIGATYNAAKAKNPLQIDEWSARMLEHVWQLAEKNELEIQNIDSHEYQDGWAPMFFLVYSLRRKKGDQS